MAKWNAKGGRVFTVGSLGYGNPLVGIVLGNVEAVVHTVLDGEFEFVGTGDPSLTLTHSAAANGLFVRAFVLDVLEVACCEGLFFGDHDLLQFFIRCRVGAVMQCNSLALDSVGIVSRNWVGIARRSRGTACGQSIGQSNCRGRS